VDPHQSKASENSIQKLFLCPPAWFISFYWASTKSKTLASYYFL